MTTKTNRPKSKFKAKIKGNHIHHIVPFHMGGLDDESNIIELSIEEHAAAHKKLFEQYGCWQDKIAWQTLSGQMSNAEAIKFAQKNQDKSWASSKKGKDAFRNGWLKRKAKGLGEPWNKGLSKDDDERIMASSQRAKEHQALGIIPSIGDTMRGKEFTNTHKQSLAEAARNRPKIKCMYCEKEIDAPMHKRWHGDNCKWKKK